MIYCYDSKYCVLTHDFFTYINILLHIKNATESEKTQSELILTVDSVTQLCSILSRRAFDWTSPIGRIKLHISGRLSLRFGNLGTWEPWNGWGNRKFGGKVSDFKFG